MSDVVDDPLVAGRYRVLSKLGEGGMGLVLRAEQLDAAGQPMREVALKMLLPDLSQDPDFSQRFLREVRVAARLRSPHVVTVYESGLTEDQRLFYSMELVEGLALSEVLRDTPVLSPQRVARIGSQICDALGEAHSQAEPIIHRDLKPENIFLETRRGHDWAKVGDFGIAKLVGERVSKLTHAGVTPGTPCYMSPEQWRGRDVDGRSDLYALGVMLHEALSGTPPFQSDEGPLGYMYQHLESEPPMLPASLPPVLRNVVRALLSKTPAERPDDAYDVKATLDAFLQGGPALDAPSTGPPADPNTRRRRLVTSSRRTISEPGSSSGRSFDAPVTPEPPPRPAPVAAPPPGPPLDPEPSVPEAFVPEPFSPAPTPSEPPASEPTLSEPELPDAMGFPRQPEPAEEFEVAAEPEPPPVATPVATPSRAPSGPTIADPPVAQSAGPHVTQTPAEPMPRPTKRSSFVAVGEVETSGESTRAAEPHPPARRPVGMFIWLMLAVIVTTLFGTQFYGESLLLWAASNGVRPLVRFGLAAGMDPNVTDNQRRTVLMLLAARGDAELVEQLLKRRVLRNRQDANGFTELMHAVASGDGDTTQALLTRDPEINATNQRGESALSLASRVGSSRIVTKLLGAGASVTLTDDEKKTPLMEAAAGGHLEVVKLLLRAGANRRQTDSLGRRAFNHAKDKGHEELLPLLR